ncbi:MAG: PIG-L family deacetylase [Ilumatobacteraceae bacterium]|jgi:LmbE family N-acetylglucosaminyl deacetylase|nr:PIG-L family deacetylase [Ilumatobacteraceae bacterium]
MLRPDEIERALVVTAHPDDVDFGAAGTVANLTDAGVAVSYCLVTDGQAGGFDHAVPRADMASIRRKEQTIAAAEVGVNDLHFLGHMDGEVVASLELRHEISRVIRTVRPQVVITQSPERNLDRVYSSHPDHTATGEATLCAVYPDARNPFAFPELLTSGLEPWSVSEVWVMGHHAPREVVDITHQVERKLRALHAHASQHPDPTAMDERVRAWFRMTAEQFGLPEGASAEVFRVIDTR